jgi:glycosyltransferase involved in cell wall biosynthesis
MSPTPRISVCLLAFNHANIVADSIRTVLAQDFDDFELVLSDDHSDDGTWEIAQSFTKLDSRVRALQPPHNLGMAGNANFSVSQSSAPYIALLHHDDLCAPSLLRRWLEVMERHPDVGFVSNNYIEFETQQASTHSLPERSEGEDILENVLFPSWACLFRGTAMIRRSAWDAIGGMRERFGLLADVDMWMRLSARYAVGYVSEPLITTRQDRPSYYPREYSQWSWPRQKLVYDIHATNQRAYYAGRSRFRHRASWTQFRFRVSTDVVRWLGYALVKRRWEMLESSAEIANEYELAPVKGLRRALIAAREKASHIKSIG